MEPILSVKDLSVSFNAFAGKVHAVRDVNFDLYKGETLAIVGESGSGKSVTTKAILGILAKNGHIDSGTIMYQGQDMAKYKEADFYKIRGKRISLVFQDPLSALNPIMKIGKQITEALVLREHMTKEQAKKRAIELMEMVGIPRPEERFEQYPFQFSGGMRQRIVIAIALASNARIMICDEPTTALDVTIQAQVLETMKELREKFGSAMIMITHDLGIIAEVCDEVSVVYAGQIVEHGTLEDVFERTLHPYTEGLFGSLPNIEERRHRLQPIPGLMPDPTDLPKGCCFAPRCKYCTEACTKARPEMKWVSDTHYVRCSRYDEPGFKIERSVQ